MPLTTPNPPAAASPIAFLDRSAAPNMAARAPLPLCHAPAWLRLWHLASLDAPSVAAVWSMAFAWVVHKRLPLWVLALQVLVVWSVYVGDRLLDARTGLRRWGNELRERHYFHWRHRRLLAPLSAIAALAAALVVLHWMPLLTRERDSLLAAASLAYFTRVHSGVTGSARCRRIRRLFSKELLVGVLFTIGCALPAWSPAHRSVLVVSTLFFAALAWLNCRAIERWESGDSRIARIAVWMAVAGAVAAGALAFLDPRAALLLAAGAVSALLLARLDHIRRRLTPITLRAAADLVLLMPALVLCAACLVRP